MLECVNSSHHCYVTCEDIVDLSLCFLWQRRGHAVGWRGAAADPATPGNMCEFIAAQPLFVIFADSSRRKSVFS